MSYISSRIITKKVAVEDTEKKMGKESQHVTTKKSTKHKGKHQDNKGGGVSTAA